MWMSILGLLPLYRTIQVLATNIVSLLILMVMMIFIVWVELKYTDLTSWERVSGRYTALQLLLMLRIL